MLCMLSFTREPLVWVRTYKKTVPRSRAMEMIWNEGEGKGKIHLADGNVGC